MFHCVYPRRGGNLPAAPGAAARGEIGLAGCSAPVPRRRGGLMRGKALRWTGLLLASLLLVPAVGRGQESLGYAMPDTTYPSPLGSTHPAEGPYFTGGFTLFQQTNPMGQQTVANR